MNAPTTHHDRGPGTGPFAVDPRHPNPPSSPAPASRVGWLVWAAGGAVASGAAIATAHGLYETAVAARVPAGIAWLYPLITDGLALVAYAATTRLRGAAARYAWAVVVLAAGLSGLAQAAYLATNSGAVGQTGALLRFGIGAWPALAAAITAHLLYLLATPPAHNSPTGAVAAVDASLSNSSLAMATRHPNHADAERAAGADTAGAGRAALPARDDGGRTAATDDRSAQVRARVQPGGDGSDRTHELNSGPVHDPAPQAPAFAPGSAGSAANDPDSPAARAAAAATAHRREHGAWPSVRALAATAEVAHGTAQTALRQLRNQPENPTPDPETTP